jgi:thymidylate synthase ThyX
MKRKIKAEIIADSKNEFGDRIITYVLTYPRIIHAELLTHRMFSRNSASSRAIPFKKMCKLVEEDPFIPIAWQKDHKGMQGAEYITDTKEIEICEKNWLYARQDAILNAQHLYCGVVGDVTKQLCNRLLEPFQWYTVIVTATEYDNFFELRCPKYEYDESTHFKSKEEYEEHYLNVHNKSNDDRTNLDWLRINKSGAEIHIQALAECMWGARNESTPKQLKAGEWHIPFGDQFDEERITEVIKSECKLVPMGEEDKIKAQWLREDIKVKIATARCARVSYMNYEGKDDYQADIKLYNRLEDMKHASPFEHCAQAMSSYEYFHRFSKGNIIKELVKSHGASEFGWCRNFKGFIQLRHKMNL